jgi:hypothetical protein
MNKHAHDAFARAHDLSPDDPDLYKEWMADLKGEERVRALEHYLATYATYDDAATRRGLQATLTVATRRLTDPKFGMCSLVKKVPSAKLAI